MSKSLVIQEESLWIAKEIIYGKKMISQCSGGAALSITLNML